MSHPTAHVPDRDDAADDEHEVPEMSDVPEGPEDLDDGRTGIVAALSPRGPVQVALGVFALCFLAAAIGYLVGTRQPPVPTSEVDRGFLIDMSDHHDQAVSMALCTVNKAQDPVVQSFAREILVFQNRDLARMGSLLEQMRIERPADEGRTAMAWMGMPTPVASMPGMASTADHEALCNATGREVDRRFLLLLRAHHLGGVHMAEVAADQAVSPSVRSLAATIARNQRIEANEYTSTLQRLGLGS
jgi:uncharacterized protein (DUF305 family)